MSGTNGYCRKCCCFACQCGSGNISSGEIAQLKAFEEAKTMKPKREGKSKKVAGVVAKTVQRQAIRGGFGIGHSDY